MSTGPILERIDDFDERLDGMRSELDELRRGVEAVHLTSTEPEVDRFEPAPATAPAPIPAPVEHTPSRPEPARPSQPSESGTVAPPYEPAFTLPSFSVSDLLGARTLAWAGGLVTLLGVVFLFVLAADRGWVGAEERLALGGLLSIGLAGSGMYIKHRYGSLVAALSAMGVGLAAGYLTLTAASATYGLLPVDLGIALASALAALAVGVAMRWRSEILAAFSLGGAMVALPLIQQGFTPLVGTFLALLFAGAAAVAISQGWRWLLITAGAVGLIEVAGVVVGAAAWGSEASLWRALALAGAFWLLGSGAGVACALRATNGIPNPLSLAFILGSASLATVSTIALLDGSALSLPAQGLALLTVAATLLFTGALISVRSSRELGAPLWGAGLVISTIAAGQLLGGPALAIAWAGQAVLMGWLTIRLRDNRLQLPALVYVTLLALYALVFEAKPDQLFEASANAGTGAISALLSAVALAGLGLLARDWRRLAKNQEGPLDATGSLGTLALIAETISHASARLSRAGLVLSGAFATYAASLGILALADSIGTDFSSAHVAVTALWALVLVAVAFVARRASAFWPELVVGFGAVLAKVVIFDYTQLADDAWPFSFLIAGAAILNAAVVWSLPGRGAGRLDATGAGAMLVSLGLLAAGIANAIEYSGMGVDVRGFALLALAAGYLALAHAVRARTAELAILATAFGAAVAASASVVLLDGTWLVVSWAVASVALAVAVSGGGAVRYRLGSLFFGVLALGHVLAFEGRPDRLFVASDDPGTGAMGVLLGAVALFAAGLALKGAARDDGDTPAGRWLAEFGDQARSLATWIGGGLLLLAISLGLLELFQTIGNAGVDTQFQRGHVALSAAWAIAALGLLWIGASRNVRTLRYAGFILFGTTLVKIFLYDLATLSAVARAGSFIAVGTLLLAAGAFYQRMLESDNDEERPENGSPAPPQALG